MIPTEVKNFLSKEGSAVLRQNKIDALRAMDQLGVDRGSDFWEFYENYQGPFISPRPAADLYDIIELSGIVDAVEYVRDRYHLEDRFLPLTSDESEGMYLYDTASGAVFDFYLRDYKEFVAGNIPPRWPNFNEFLRWYFDENAQA